MPPAPFRRLNSSSNYRPIGKKLCRRFDEFFRAKVLHYPRVRYETSTLTNYKGLEMMCMVAVLLAALLGSSVLASNQNGKNL